MQAMTTSHWAPESVIRITSTSNVVNETLDSLPMRTTVDRGPPESRKTLHTTNDVFEGQAIETMNQIIKGEKYCLP